MIYVADDTNLDTVITAVNALLSLIFLVDFTYRLFTTESKSRYFWRQFGWADLLASLPFPQAKIFPRLASSTCSDSFGNTASSRSLAA